MKTKRLIALLMAMTILLSMSACGKKEEAPQASSVPAATPETTVPAPTEEPEPEWEPGIVRAAYIGGLYKLLQRGDEVTVIGEWEGYFIIEGEQMPLLVEKRFLRPETEEAPEEKQGYARSNAAMHLTAYFRGEPTQLLKRNTKVTVVDTKEDWALIRLEDGTEGYVNAKDISQWYIGGGSSSGEDYSGGGGSSGGGGGGGGSAAPQDGTDVNLGNISYTGGSVQVELLGNIQQPAYEEYEKPAAGIILCADTEAYAYLFLRDDELKVTQVTEATEETEATCTVWVHDLFLTVPRWAIRMEEDEAYEPWTAYGRYGGVAYTEIQKWHELMKVTTNQEVEVVDELTEVGMYVIQADGSYGYMVMDKLATSKYYPPSSSDDGSDGGYSGGGSSGGGGGSSEGWTPPVL